MVKKSILLTAPMLALVLPELFQDVFDGLRKSQYLWLYQSVCGAWLVVVIGAMLPWRRMASMWRRVKLGVSVASGTARFHTALGTVMKPSADLLVFNAGAPFKLLTRARLTKVASGFEWSQSDAWEYRQRPVNGRNGTSFFHIATVEQDRDRPHGWVVSVRAEDMMAIRTWTGRELDDLWFEVEWRLFEVRDGSLHEITVTHTTVTLNADRRSLYVAII